MRERVHKFGWSGIALIALLPVYAMAGGDQAPEQSADEEKASIETPAPGGKGPAWASSISRILPALVRAALNTVGAASPREMSLKRRLSRNNRHRTDGDSDSSPKQGAGYPGYRGTGGSDYPRHRQYGDPPLTPSIRNRASQSRTGTAALMPSQGRLLHAAAFGDIDGVRSLLDSGASANARSRDKRGRTALILAAQGGHDDVVEALLEKGARIEDRDKTGHTALNWAAMRGQAATARVLLEGGADVNTMNNGLVSPVLYAVGTRNKAMVRLVAEAGADLQVETRDNKMTPLLLAIEHRDIEMTRLLVEAGADVNKSNRDGYSPLMAAAEKADHAITKLLLAKGANADASDNKGRTALMLARKSGDESTVEALSAEVETAH